MKEADLSKVVRLSGAFTHEFFSLHGEANSMCLETAEDKRQININGKLARPKRFELLAF